METQGNLAVEKPDFSGFLERNCIRCGTFCSKTTCIVDHIYLRCPGCHRYMFKGITEQWKARQKEKSSQRTAKDDADVRAAQAMLEAFLKE